MKNKNSKALCVEGLGFMCLGCWVLSLLELKVYNFKGWVIYGL
jgi:hypothetical protein